MLCLHVATVFEVNKCLAFQIEAPTRMMRTVSKKEFNFCGGGEGSIVEIKYA